MHLKTEAKALLGQIHDLFLTETSVDLKQNQGWDKTTRNLPPYLGHEQTC